MKPLIVFYALLIGMIPINSLSIAAGDFAPDAPGPGRIVSMTLGTDEILLSLVHPERIIAVTHYAIDPTISNVSRQAKIIRHQIKKAGVEQIAALNPDLVLVASYTAVDVVNQLSEIGLTVTRLDTFTSIQGIMENIRTVGRKVLASKKAEEVIAEMTLRLNRLEESISDIRERPGVLSYSPGGWTAGKETTFNEMVVRAGGRNLAAESGITGHKKLSLETIVMLDPAIIILSAWDEDGADFVGTFRNHPALGQLSAIKRKQVYVFPEKYLTTVSQYIVEATEALARLIHPEHFRAVPIDTGRNEP